VGPEGPKGDKGDQGIQGIQGVKGDQGDQCPPGADGADGVCDCPVTQEQLDDIYARIEYLESLHYTRFTDMGDGTIRDNETGLIWLRNASCSELPGTDTSGRADWDTATAAAAGLENGTCGLTDGSAAGDWRLPTKEEWEAFMSVDYDNPALVNTVGDAQWSEGDAFTGVQSSHYWSSTEFDSYSAWYADMGYGSMSNGNKDHYYYVWPVRSDN